MHKGDELPYHMFRLVEGVRRRLVRELQARLEPPYPRGSHMRLLGMIPVDGMRITDLAALSAMTKQSLGELVTAMEAHGLVESRRLDTDRRVRLVVPTKAGDRRDDGRPPRRHRGSVAQRGRRPPVRLDESGPR